MAAAISISLTSVANAESTSSTQSADRLAGTSATEPNITGVWELYPDPFGGEENTVIELTAPEGGPKLREPYATQWKERVERREAGLKAGTPLVDRSTLCLPEGMPLIMGAIFPIQILQNPGQVTVLAEFLTQTRRIHLGKTMPALEDIPPYYYGYSVGHWEGDTLVVTTASIREDTEFYDIPHSREMKITERIRLTEPGYMENRITIEDPAILAEPYRFTYGYKRNDAYEINEYFCTSSDQLIELNADGTVSMKTDHGDDN
ncbi:MAG: hypothetical protein KKD64_13475 [Alphaproteobacteria bacterium]|nr:hypothetical protein [Alphaproteobacteria bacterium]MBU0792514.1 hypothetical protein [Alphaproteobacteria bacterium]MBU0877360.1 hypothetical protein [Alphaproteobacteria bacterium]MBU1770645.1 hypothetical protein [Alphaproteobacteria bacterium]